MQCKHGRYINLDKIRIISGKLKRYRNCQINYRAGYLAVEVKEILVKLSEASINGIG